MKSTRIRFTIFFEVKERVFKKSIKKITEKGSRYKKIK